MAENNNAEISQKASKEMFLEVNIDDYVGLIILIQNPNRHEA
jgi:hypothetical protein